MADFTPTQSQKNAIEARESSVLVSAGAGSGKTTVLTNRLIGFLTDPEHPVNIDKFLIITFTKAAAEELRGRILKAISKALEKDPGNTALRRQLALVNRAWIGTIHSFCSNVIRENSLELGISPDFKVLDDDRGELMLASALDRTLEEFYAEPEKHPYFLELADSFGAGRDDNALAELVTRLYSQMQSHAFPEKWALGCAEAYEIPYSDAGETVWGRVVLKNIGAQLDYLKTPLGKVEALLEEINGEGSKLYQTAVDLKAYVEGLSDACAVGWQRAYAYPAFEFPTRITAPKELKGCAEYDEAKKLFDDVKKKELNGKILPMLSQSSDEIVADISAAAPYIRALTELTLAVNKAFATDKRRAGVLDFNDLEHFAAKLLIDEETEQPTQTAKHISQRFVEIMVDEYQDVSPVQDSLFRAVAKHNPKFTAPAQGETEEQAAKRHANENENLFSVGDIKQAIYRFRLADPTIFADKNRLYSDYSAENPDKQARKIYLRENYRSRREVIDAVNTLFSCIMSEQTGSVKYDDTQKLVYGANYPGEVPVPELIIRDDSSDDILCGEEAAEEESTAPAAEEDTAEGEEGKTAAAEIIKEVLPEADMTARLIRQLLDSESVILSEGRPAQAGDIAILLRRNSDIELYGNALNAAGIGVSCGRGGEFFTSPEIAAVVAMISVLDNPHQDIPLLTVLTCPAFAFSPNDLSAIRAVKKHTDIFSALCLAAESDEKAGAAVEKINALRLIASDLSPVELVGKIINDLDLLALCSAMPNGAQRRANLLYLTELAQSFADSGSCGLHSFVGWLGRKAAKGDTAAAVSEGAADGVKIMTMHKSKGLEFPVVFVCGLGRQFNCRDAMGNMLIHKDLGFGPVVIDTERRIKYKSIAHNAINLVQKQEYISEEMRLLYVAMTRAKERLIMTACVKSAEKLLASSPAADGGVMNPFEAAKVSSPAQWIIRAAVENKQTNLKYSVYRSADYARAEAQAEQKPEADKTVLAELERRLAFSYAYPHAVALPSKVTATELKGFEEKPDGFEKDSVDIIVPKKRFFRHPELGGTEKEATGAERGTATHLVMQYMRFAENIDTEYAAAEIARLEREGFISPREAQCVDADSIVKLFKSDIGRKMLAAGRKGKLRREFRFSLLADASELGLCRESGEKTLLQGVVDCCVEEDDGIIIIDYKTDGVFGDDKIDERAEFYAGQVKTYAIALERILEKPVKECVLYFLRPGCERTIKTDGKL